MKNRKLRMGMVGGGIGAFIGVVHRMAAGMDNEIELVCGAFSSDPEKSKASGKELYLPEDRIYGSYQEMIIQEKALPIGERMDFVSIVTPNHMHFGPAKFALENGFHVICDKPIAFSLPEAKELNHITAKTNLVFALTHNYTGYPMVRQAKAMIAEGQLGKIRKVVVEYPQGWLATLVEAQGNKQAEWRTDPTKSGKGGAVGDIGTHAFNLAEYITQLQVAELCADVSTYVDGRLLDDDANVLLRFNNGAKGILHCSQICVGEENDLNIRIYGEKAGLEWKQMEPNTLLFKQQGKPTHVYRTGNEGLHPAADTYTRIPSGHPEGYLEAFANIYKNFALTIKAKHNNETLPYIEFPSINDGIRGMIFIDKVIESGKSDQKWIAFEDK